MCREPVTHGSDDLLERILSYQPNSSVSADPAAAEQQRQRVTRLKSFLRRRKEQLAEAAARREAEAEEQRLIEATEDPEARYHQHPNNRHDPNHPANRPRSPHRPPEDDLVSHFSFASGFHQLHGSRIRRVPHGAAAGSARGAGSEDGGGTVPGEGTDTAVTPRFKRASVCLGNGGGEKGTGAGVWTGSGGEGSPGLGTRSGASTWSGEAEAAGNGTVTFLTTVPSLGALEEEEGNEGKGWGRGPEEGPGGLEMGESLAAIQRMEEVLNRHHQRCGTPRARAEVNPVSLAGSVVAAAMGAAAAGGVGGGGPGGRMTSARKPMVVSVHSATAAKLLRSGSRGALGSRGSQRGQAAEGRGGGSSSRTAAPGVGTGAGASGRSGLTDINGRVLEVEAPQDGQESEEEDLWDVQLTDPGSKGNTRGAGAGREHAQRKRGQAGGAPVPRLALQSPATGLRTLSCGPFSARLAMSARLTAAEAAGTISGAVGTSHGGGMSPQRALHGSLSARAASSRAATPRAAQGSTSSTGFHLATQQPLQQQQQHKDLVEQRRQPPSPARVPSKLAANPRAEALAAAADIRRGAWGTPRTHSHGRVIIHQDSQDISAWDAPSTPPRGPPVQADSSVAHCGARSAPHLHPSSPPQQPVAHHPLPGGGHLLPSAPGSHSLQPTSHTHMGSGLNTHPTQHYHDTLSLHMQHHHHHHHHLPGHTGDQQQRPWTAYDSHEHARYVPMPLFATSGAVHPGTTGSSENGTGPHMELGLGLGGAGASLRVSTQADSGTPRQQLAAQQHQQHQHQQRGAGKPPPSPRHSSSSNTPTGTSRQHLDHGVEVVPMAWVTASPAHASSPQLRSSHHPHLHSSGPGRPSTASAPGTQPSAGSMSSGAHGGSGRLQGSASRAAGSVGRRSLDTVDRPMGHGGRSNSTPLMRASWDASGTGVVPSGAGGGMGSLRGRLMRTSLASSLRGTLPVTPRGGNAGHSVSDATASGAAGAGGGWAGGGGADGSVLASVRGLGESPRGQAGAGSEESCDGMAWHGGEATDVAGEGAAALSPQRSARVKRKPGLFFGGSVVPRAAAAAAGASSAAHTPADGKRPQRPAAAEQHTQPQSPTSTNPHPAHTAGSSPRGQAPRHHLGVFGQLELPPMGHPYPAPQPLQLQGGHLRSRGEPAAAGGSGGGARGAAGAGREGAAGGRGGGGSITGHLGPWEGDGLPSPTGPRAHSSLSQGHPGPAGGGAGAGAAAGGGGERVLSASTSSRAIPVQPRVEQLRQEGEY